MSLYIDSSNYIIKSSNISNQSLLSIRSNYNFLYSLYLTIAIMCILVLLFIPILFVGEISNMRLVFLFIGGLIFIANYIETEKD